MTLQVDGQQKQARHIRSMQLAAERASQRAADAMKKMQRQALKAARKAGLAESHALVTSQAAAAAAAAEAARSTLLAGKDATDNWGDAWALWILRFTALRSS